MATVESELLRRTASYAMTFHHPNGYRHHVASPLGGWLWPAGCAPAAAGLADLVGDPVAGGAGVLVLGRSAR
jgi:hypothetical protein